MEVNIYCLTDARNGSKIYVGATRGSIKNRLSQHNSKSNPTKWLKNMKKSGIKLGIELIEVCDIEDVREREEYWCKKLYKDGHPIVNWNGCSGYPRQKVEDPKLTYTTLDIRLKTKDMLINMSSLMGIRIVDLLDKIVSEYNTKYSK